jgi:hypothetical protein
MCDGEVLYPGHILDFKDHSILVGECIGSSIIPREEDVHSPAHKSVNNSRSFAQVVKSSISLKAPSLPEAPPIRWKASCSSFNDGSSTFQAFLLLRPQAKRLVLLDTHEEVLDARFLLENERVHPGLILDLISHTVVVGERTISDSLALGVNILKSSNSKPDSHQKTNISQGTKDVLALDFSKESLFKQHAKVSLVILLHLPMHHIEELF